MITMENHEDYYDYDEDSDQWERGCILGDACLHHDPEHTSDECYDLEAAEEWTRDAMRDSDEYRFGKDEGAEAWRSAVLELRAEMWGEIWPETDAEQTLNDFADRLIRKMDSQ